MSKDSLKTIGWIIGGVIFGAFAFWLLNTIIIGDPCDYHNKDIKTGSVFNLFYEISSNTGHHPEPTAFNFIFAITTGAVIGFLLSRKFIKNSAN